MPVKWSNIIWTSFMNAVGTESEPMGGCCGGLGGGTCSPFLPSFLPPSFLLCRCQPARLRPILLHKQHSPGQDPDAQHIFSIIKTSLPWFLRWDKYREHRHLWINSRAHYMDKNLASWNFLKIIIWLRCPWMRLWSASVHSWVTFWPVLRVITHGQLIALSIYAENRISMI